MAGSTSRTRIGTPARPLPKGGQYFHQGLRYTTADGLYDNRARIYSPTMMRFLQNDPLGFAAGDANTYRYEGNGPTSGSDPSGLWWGPVGHHWVPFKSLKPYWDRLSESAKDVAARYYSGPLTEPHG